MNKTEFENTLENYKFKCIGSYTTRKKTSYMYYNHGMLIYLNEIEEAVIIGHFPYELVKIIEKSFGTVRSVAAPCDEDEWNTKKVFLYLDIPNHKVQDYCESKDGIPVRCYHISYKKHFESFLRLIGNYMIENPQKSTSYYPSLQEFNSDLITLKNYFLNTKKINIVTSILKSCATLDTNLYAALIDELKILGKDNSSSTIINIANILSVVNQKLGNIKLKNTNTFLRDILNYLLENLHAVFNPFENPQFELKSPAEIQDSVDIVLTYDQSNSNPNWIDLKISQKGTPNNIRVTRSYKGFKYTVEYLNTDDTITYFEHIKDIRKSTEKFQLYSYDIQNSTKVRVLECDVKNMTLKIGTEPTIPINSWDEMSIIEKYIAEIGSKAAEISYDNIIDSGFNYTLKEEDYV